jgi:RNA polymerase-binding transcription factor DksA/predicted enzyme related to lactoylglutathione lyase
MDGVHLALIALIVEDYDPAIEFFVGVLGFDLVEDSPATTNDGRPKRWVVVRPPGAETGLLLARADGPRQQAAVGDQHAGRVGFFLRVDDFDAAHRRMLHAGVVFVSPPRTEPYGRIAIFEDIAGNRWDLLGPPGEEPAASEPDRLLLDDADRAALGRQLLAERSRVSGQLAGLERSFADLVASADVEPADDEHDPDGTTAYERAQVSSLARSARARLAEIDAALRAIEAGEGDPGRCTSCGRPIGMERLLARPGTVRCVHCA